MWEIGRLSAKYESDGNPGAIGYDSGGGWSYGINQIETKGGTFNTFMTFLQGNYQSIWKTLQTAGGNSAAIRGTDNFKAAWENQAKTNTQQFTDAQHDFIVDRMYGVTIKRLALANINLATPPRSKTLADVIYSLAVMAGPGVVKSSGAGCCGLVFDTLCTLNVLKTISTLDDGVLIDAIYAQKLKRIDTGREYKNQTPAIRASVRNRVVNEHKDAVAELVSERAGTLT